MAERVHLVSLGCARNDVDSEELLARLELGGFELTDDPQAAAAIVVNTCGFIDAAKKDSVDTLLAASDLKQTGAAKAVVAVGCMAERYGRELADALPEADAVLGFDAYPDIAERLRWIIDGGHVEAHRPRDRRHLLPLAPAERPAAAADGVVLPGHAPASGPRVLRRRTHGGPMAALKVASGCDRRCTFCAIPSFRGSYLSRPIDELVAEARWLAEQGVKELFLVSENTSSYGKDLKLGPHALQHLLAELAKVEGIEWLRVSYLQPAELRPGMIEGMLAVDKVVPYFDLSFQHAAPGVLRRMRRFGDPDSFLALLERVRAAAPLAGVRSNVIVGFPGETESDFATLMQFAAEARLDALGVFGYSDEQGTEAERLDGKLGEEVIAERLETMAELAQELCDQRAAERVGQSVRVLVEEPDGTGRAEHQGPEVDGCTRVSSSTASVGSLVSAVVVEADGIDLIATEAP
ncbi:30S ribosomal protein S12 methylthiotransferase RimO [Micropruina sp.]|uniref:30S ribosomal protein S12 methylthiotransferase RimO n=1 Tax=Micropruina sp. TaxID=2737536 RepID=UPI0039E714B0